MNKPLSNDDKFSAKTWYDGNYTTACGRLLTVHVVMVHFVVGPYTTLVAKRVHSVVHMVNVRTLDVPVHVDLLEYFGIGPTEMKFEVWFVRRRQVGGGVKYRRRVIVKIPAVDGYYWLH